MPAKDTREESPALKEMFNAARYRALADTLGELYPKFDRKRFLEMTLTGLEERSLLQRLRRTTEALHATLPSEYRAALQILDRLAPMVSHAFGAIVLPDFVGLYGRAPEHRKRSLEALKFYTTFGSSEFAIREFIKLDVTDTLRVMLTWADDENEHVRRLASEGSRPRLPWSFRLDAIVKDPTLTAPILQKLIADPSLYVRKSVANHLNDISKDHPDWLIAWLRKQDLKNDHTRWVAKRALRTLIKKGHPGALSLVGATGAAELVAPRLKVSPSRIQLGDSVTLSFECQAAGSSTQRLVIDYAVHFIKSSGAASAKVFKWKELTVEPGARIALEKTQRIQDFTTRKHYAGTHKVEVFVNGQSIATSAFVLNP